MIVIHHASLEYVGGRFCLRHPYPSLWSLLMPSADDLS